MKYIKNTQSKLYISLFYTYSCLILCTEILSLMYANQILPKFSHRILGRSGLELSFLLVSPSKVSLDYKFVVIFNNNVDETWIFEMYLPAFYTTQMAFSLPLTRNLQSIIIEVLENGELSNTVIRIVSFTCCAHSLRKNNWSLFYETITTKLHKCRLTFLWSVLFPLPDFHPKRNV